MSECQFCTAHYNELEMLSHLKKDHYILKPVFSQSESYWRERIAKEILEHLVKFRKAREERESQGADTTVQDCKIDAIEGILRLITDYKGGEQK